MKKLCFILFPSNKLWQVILIDQLKKMISHNGNKTIVFYPSTNLAPRRGYGDFHAAKDLAHNIARASHATSMSLGNNLTQENLSRGFSNELWKFFDEWDSYGNFENVLVVLPVAIADTFTKGTYYFHRHVTGSLFGLLAEGAVTTIDFSDYQKGVYEAVQTFDPRFNDVLKLPWQLMPSGYSSPMKHSVRGTKDTRTALNILVLDWLKAHQSNNSWGRNAKRRVLNQVKKMSQHLTYKENKIEKVSDKQIA